jgi:hypothetical protein
MVGKVLKISPGGAARYRGAKGGYALARPPEAITVAEIIEALEGPIALVECSAGPGQCGQESSCHVRDPWQIIHSTIRSTLTHVTLHGLVEPRDRALLQVDGLQREAAGGRAEEAISDATTALEQLAVAVPLLTTDIEQGSSEGSSRGRCG